MTVERLSVWNTTGPKRPFLAVRAEAYDALEADRDHLRADLAVAEREAEFLRGELAKAALLAASAPSPSPPDTDERTMRARIAKEVRAKADTLRPSDSFPPEAAFQNFRGWLGAADFIERSASPSLHGTDGQDGGDDAVQG